MTRSEHPPALIIGDSADPHVAAVTSAVAESGQRVLVVDASTLGSTRWRRSAAEFEVLCGGLWERPARGWLRRLAPAGHHGGVPLGSLAAAEATARLALISSLCETSIEWLSDYWGMLRAENKLVQYRTALDLGVPVPPTAVVADVRDLGPELGDPIVMKPLGLGEFREDGTSYAVHARLVDRHDAVLSAAHIAPMIAQRQISAVEHLRVVTVQSEAWTSALDASALPLDWRRSEQAHLSWSPTEPRPEIESMASQLAKALNVGYSSQDWMVDETGQAWFIDCNPGGQWLFLPEPVSSPATKAIARWLVGTR